MTKIPALPHTLAFVHICVNPGSVLGFSSLSPCVTPMPTILVHNLSCTRTFGRGKLARAKR